MVLELSSSLSSSTEEVLRQFFSLLSCHSAVLEETLSIQLLFNDFGLIISEVGKLAVRVLVDPSTLHEVLGELAKSHDISSGNSLG